MHLSRWQPLRRPAGIPQCVHALAALQAAIPGRLTWTRAQCVLFGRLFLDDYGVPPAPQHCRAMYGMPDRSTITRLVGPMRVYQEAIVQAGPLTLRALAWGMP